MKASIIRIVLLLAVVIGIPASLAFQNPGILTPNMAGNGTPASNSIGCNSGVANQIYIQWDATTGHIWICDQSSGSYQWDHQSVAIAATTASIGGALVSLGCSNQTTVSVPGATTVMSCNISGAGGTQPANTQPQCYVSAANTVTVQFCTAIVLGITPTAQTYNLRLS